MNQHMFPEFIHSEFTRLFAGRPRFFRAPGRINIIGEHTDYNEGFVLPSTVDLFTWAAAARNESSELRVHLCIDGSSHRIGLNNIVKSGDGQVAEYLKGVVWALKEEGIDLVGVDIVIAGNIPLGGGLSSSASLELTLATALLDLADVDMERKKIARICQRAEYEFVGVQCGIMDQYAIALGVRDHAMMLDCRTLEYEMLPLPPDARFLVVHSGVSHQLPAGEYNTRQEECALALSRLRDEMPELVSLRDLDLDELKAHKSLLDDRLFRRCRHVLTENNRVGTAVAALKRASLEQLGRLLSQSHCSLKDDYEVSCQELDRLVGIAESCESVLGSRMMGGGFGGCTISLIRSEASDEASEYIRLEVARQTGAEPWMHAVGSAGPVTRIQA